MTSYSFNVINDPKGTVGTRPDSLNNLGQIVGGYTFRVSDAFRTEFFKQAFFYDGQSYSDLTVFSGGPVARNDPGQMVGSTADGQGVLYSNGTFTNFRVFGDPTGPTGINNAGQIVGTFFDGSIDHGFLRSGGVDTQLDFPSARLTSAHGINNNGQIVGDYNDASGRTHGFLYSGGTYTTLEDPLSDNGTLATGINDKGQIVGYYLDPKDGITPHGFIYQAGIFDNIDLNGVTRVAVGSINNADQVVGTYGGASDGTSGFLATVAPPRPLNLQYVAPGKFDSRGPFSISHGELVFSNSGNAVIWEQRGNAFGQATVPNGSMGAEWSAFGTGTFSGDGRTDILWTNGAGGQVAIWQMNGAYLNGFGIPQGHMGGEWQVVSLGDFNGDGNTDVAWENSGGNLNVWSMNGRELQSAGLSNGQIGSEWHIVTQGDFFGTGRDGLLWESAGGDLQSWALNGAQVASVIGVGHMGSEWRCVGTGSFPNDGPTDVVWVSTNNDLQIWQMANGSIARIITPSGHDGTEWRLTAVGDFGGGGGSNLLWLNNNGSADIWQINGSQVSNQFASVPNGETLRF